jgi:hypothetical protein
MSKRKTLSICLPTYEMHGLGEKYLCQSLDILVTQTFKHFDVVISDNSVNDGIKKVCEEYKGKLDIKYFKHPGKKEMSPNTNYAIQKATGVLLKILFQDDYLYGNDALKTIVDNFDLHKDQWLVTACTHTKNTRQFFRPFYPKYNSKIHMGRNTISSPSVLTLKNNNDKTFLFDENLKWFMDVDYYKRLHNAYGEPKIVNTICTVNRVGAHQTTNRDATEELRKTEFKYIAKKYDEWTLDDVTVVSVSGIDPTGGVNAIQICLRGMEFGGAVIVSHTKPENLDPRITFKQCRPDHLQSKDPKNKDDYSKFMAYDLGDYIDTEFALIVHNDAYVLRPHKWDYEFLEYDYIGAPWKEGVHFTPEGVNVRVGNGGFSLRSKRMMNILRDMKLPFTDNGTGYVNEDGLMCVYHRKALEDAGIKFAPVPVAARFSQEKHLPDSYPEPFGFHDNKDVMPRFFHAKYWIKQILQKLNLRKA